MVTSAYHGEDLPLHLGEVVHDALVAEPHDDVAEGDKPCVACAILLELRFLIVPLASVDFDDEPVSHDEVDPTDAGDPHLSAQPHAAGAKPESDDRFSTGLSASIDPTEDASPARGAAQHHVDLPLSDEAKVEQRVGSNRNVEWGAAP